MELNSEVYLYGGLMLLVIIIVIALSVTGKGNLNKIKSKPVGDGQHGAARLATPKEISQKLTLVKFEPDKWRIGEKLPSEPGVIIGFPNEKKAHIDTDDNHTMVISPPGGGKTTFFLYPNLEYTCACGLSFLSTDTKGDNFRDYAGIAKEYYGYEPYVVDLRYPSKSHKYNMLHSVNKYMDLYKSTGKLSYKAKAEKYAKINSKTIISLKGFKSGGQNAFFYDAAEGLISSIILLIAELCKPEERHIVSVFKLVKELFDYDPNTIPKSKEEAAIKTPQRYFEQLIAILPSEHKAAWLASSALAAPSQSMASVISTSMSRLLSFIDSDIEQIVCFDSNIDASKFYNNKTAVFIVFPENDEPKHFMVSLFVKQFYNECLEIADENDNKLDKRIYFYLDEYGTIPAFENAKNMFSAGRSRNILQVPMIQSFSQLDDNYGHDGTTVIKECCQNVLFAGMPPLSKTAEELSKSLGNQTVMSGSISNSSGKTASSSTSYQMVRKPLMAADEIKTLQQGEWVFNKTGMYPMKTKVRRFNEVGINLDRPFKIAEQSNQTVHYASRLSIMEAAKNKYLTNYSSTISDYANFDTSSSVNTNKKSISEEFFN